MGAVPWEYNGVVDRMVLMDLFCKKIGLLGSLGMGRQRIYFPWSTPADPLLPGAVVCTVGTFAPSREQQLCSLS